MPWWHSGILTQRKMTFQAGMRSGRPAPAAAAGAQRLQHSRCSRSRAFGTVAQRQQQSRGGCLDRQSDHQAVRHCQEWTRQRSRACPAFATGGWQDNECAWFTQALISWPAALGGGAFIRMPHVHGIAAFLQSCELPLYGHTTDRAGGLAAVLPSRVETPHCIAACLITHRIHCATACNSFGGRHWRPQVSGQPRRI